MTDKPPPSSEQHGTHQPDGTGAAPRRQPAGRARLPHTHHGQVPEPTGPHAPSMLIVYLPAEKIQSGKLKPGDRVPGVTELAESCNVSHSTARRAHAKLKTWASPTPCPATPHSSGCPTRTAQPNQDALPRPGTSRSPVPDHTPAPRSRLLTKTPRCRLGDTRPTPRPAGRPHLANSNPSTSKRARRHRRLPSPARPPAQQAHAPPLPAGHSQTEQRGA